ncbi:ABC transporter ATP-binding protein [Pseudolabrys sp.]|uniref:ABC transporter ATP-binding protein n=1 Tax=Pseudolabrys sp. TaxID=1960880 RepID=UPI003D0E701F
MVASNKPALLVADNAVKFFGAVDAPIKIFEQLNFSICAGEFVSIVGPSGCGKTTLLLCLSGLEALTSGKILFRGEVVRGSPKGVAVVFQDYSRSLFPWRNNIDNVLFGMRRLEGLSKSEKRDIAAELLKTVGLESFEYHYPWQVSGGMQQRVAIARALASQSDLVLLDEPFASIDAQTRADMQDLVLRVFAKFKQTCILVTHDIEEAIYMGSRVCVLSRRPSKVIADFKVSLTFPRDQLETREDPRFLKLRHQVLELVRGASRGDSQGTPPIAVIDDPAPAKGSG